MRDRHMYWFSIGDEFHVSRECNNDFIRVQWMQRWHWCRKNAYVSQVRMMIA